MPAQTESICILDDDSSVRRSLVQLLDSDGLMALSFEDAEDFLAHAHNYPVLLAVLDVWLPETRGVAQHESDCEDRQGNTRDSRRRAGRRRVCVCPKAVRRRDVSLVSPSSTPLRGVTGP